METYKEPFNTNPEFIGQLRHNGAGNKRKAATSREKQQHLQDPGKLAEVTTRATMNVLGRTGLWLRATTARTGYMLVGSGMAGSIQGVT